MSYAALADRVGEERRRSARSLLHQASGPMARVAYLFLVPSLVFLAAFTLWPILWAVWASFRGRIGREELFVGLDNYVRVLTDPAGQQVLVNTFLYVVAGLIMAVFGGLLLAVLMNQAIRWTGLLRFPFLATVALPMVSVASIWLFLYTPRVGAINRALVTLGLPTFNWLGEPDLALPSLFVVFVWKQLGYFALFYLAALQALSSEVLDAARLDGVGFWSGLRHIVWPLVSPTTYFVSTVAVLTSLQQVDHVFVLTAGGPNNATNMALYYVYEQGFKYFKTGPASAVTVLLLAVLLTLAFLQFRFVERRVHYQ
jgi:sn-glycerol 3-phosphate transport system permease protein